MIKEWNVCYCSSQVEITSQQAKDRQLSIMKTRHMNKILKHTSLQKNYITIKEIIIDEISLQIKLSCRRYWCKKCCCLKVITK
jgi:RNase P subunit RPR2